MSNRTTASFILNLTLILSVIGCSDAPIEGVNGGTNLGGNNVDQQGGTAGADVCLFDEMAYALGSVRCEDGEQFVCSGLGLWSATGVIEGCERTIDLCAEARASNSYIGCEYWPVDLDNAIEVVGLPINGSCGDQDGLKLRSDLQVCIRPGEISAEAGLCDAGECPPEFSCNVTPVCVLDAQASRFTVVVSNPSLTRGAEVTLTDALGQSVTRLVNPGAVSSIVPELEGWVDLSIDGTSQNRNAYRLTSDIPIVAYQFNPLDNEFVFSNDGSLLLPSHAFQNDYFVLTLPTLDRRPFDHAYHGYFSIVASAEGSTRIRVTTSADVRAGVQVPSLPARTPREYELNQYEVLHLEAAGDGDLTGSRVEVLDANKGVGVFVGHEAVLLTDLRPTFTRCRDRSVCTDGEFCGSRGVCTRQCSGAGTCPVGFYCLENIGECVPGVCCADHMEEQLFPVGTWGKDFVVARTRPRSDRARQGAQAPDFVRILARADDTTVSIQPAISNACAALAAGEYCDIFIDRDVRIIASEPILVGHFLISTDGQVGDPALSFAVPVEQYRTEYTFLTPQEYDEDYVTVVAKSGGTVDAVMLDGVDITGQLTAIDSDYVGGYIAVAPGQHTLSCPNTCGVLVYGYSQAVSYLFAGGLDLELINDF